MNSNPAAVPVVLFRIAKNPDRQPDMAGDGGNQPGFACGRNPVAALFEQFQAIAGLFFVELVVLLFFFVHVGGVGFPQKAPAFQPGELRRREEELFCVFKL